MVPSLSANMSQSAFLLSDGHSVTCLSYVGGSRPELVPDVCPLVLILEVDWTGQSYLRAHLFTTSALVIKLSPSTDLLE